MAQNQLCAELQMKSLDPQSFLQFSELKEWNFPDEYSVYWYSMCSAHTSAQTQLITKAIQEHPNPLPT